MIANNEGGGMNPQARTHVEKAAEYVGRGEEFYRKAAVEMRAAKDAGATWVEIADGLGRSDDWCRKIVRWAETPASDRADLPFAADTERRLAAREKALSDPKQAARIVAELPREVKSEIRHKLEKQVTRARREYNKIAAIAAEYPTDSNQRSTIDARHRLELVTFEHERVRA